MKELRLNGTYLCDSPSGDGNLVLCKVIRATRWEWPEWVAYEVQFPDGYTDFTDKYGRGFVNVWGITMYTSAYSVVFRKMVLLRRNLIDRLIRALKKYR